MENLNKVLRRETVTDDKRQIRLKKDIVIPAGTILRRAPTVTQRVDDSYFDCTIGLSPNTYGVFEYSLDTDHEILSEYFEVVE